MYPITPLGKFLGAIIALIGIGFFALPAGVLSGAFAEQLARRREAKTKVCPHCGREIE
jgi:voltage-gated potassium channel